MIRQSTIRFLIQSHLPQRHLTIDNLCEIAICVELVNMGRAYFTYLNVPMSSSDSMVSSRAADCPCIDCVDGITLAGRDMDLCDHI